jgi:ABC-type sugar transport system permease subunit
MAAAGVARGRGRPRRWGRPREWGTAFVMLLPSFVILGVFVLYPLGRAVYLGRTQADAFGRNRRVIGWSQFLDVFRSTEFQHTLGVTLKFVALTVPAGLVLGIGLAVLADKHVRGIGFFRTVFSSTVATSVAVASLIWLVLLQPSTGLLPDLLPFDVLKTPGLLNDGTWALPSVAITSIWANLGFTFIVVTAGLQGIPTELYESAYMDGAGAWTRLTNVTLPMLSPTILFVLVALTSRAFQSYGEIDLLTKGGPARSTETVTYFIYGESSVISNNDGLQAAAAVLLFLVLLAVTILQFRGLERRVHYGGG